MQADTKTIHGILAGDHRYVVPPYQRPYVWERDRQWVPLWDDVVATVDRLAEARRDAELKGKTATQADGTVSPHFLGAVVVEQLPTNAGEVDRHAVVDGQQRLTTIQLMLRGVLDAFPDRDHEPTRKSRAQLRKLIRNDEDVVGDSDSLYKLWPRRSERPDFVAAMDEAEAPDPSSSRFAAARAFFADEAARWLIDPDSARDPYTNDDIDGRVLLLTGTIQSLLKLVTINLDGVDDAQVIFEVLNARNTPLTAADLVKNLLFMRAEQEDPGAVEDLYDEYWKPFDDDGWWSDTVGTGHAARPRMDRFLGDFLIAQTGHLVNLGHLYGNARQWIVDSNRKVEDVLRDLRDFASGYRRVQLRDTDGLEQREIRALESIRVLRVVAADPLLLWALTRASDVLPTDRRVALVKSVESYLVRRMATKYQTRAYSQVFAEVLRDAQEADDIAAAVEQSLLGAPHGYVWPTNDDIEHVFATSRAYGPGGMNQARLRLLLGAVDRRMHEADSKSEDVEIEYGNLTIEHVMPQKWRTHWPVEAGSAEAEHGLSVTRDQAVQRIGNLTLLTTALNPSVSNSGWAAKREQIPQHSVLKLNAEIVQQEEWNEQTIEARGRSLAADVAAIWPRPELASAPVEEKSEEHLDEETIDIIHLQLMEESVQVEDDLVFSGKLIDLMESLGIVADAETEQRLHDEALEHLVGNGLVETLDDGRLRVIEAESEPVPVPDVQ